MSIPSQIPAPKPVEHTRRTAHPVSPVGAPRRAPERETVTGLRMTTSRSQPGFPTWLAAIMMIPVALYGLTVIPGAPILVVLAWAGVVSIVWIARNYSRAGANERPSVRVDRPGRIQPQTTLRPARRAPAA